MRIVIVTYNWPPRNSISTHRPYSWASYWSKKGAKVTVLTSEKQNFDEPLDMPLPDLEGVNVIQVPYVDLFNLLPIKLVKFPFILNIAKKIKLWQIRNLGSSYDPRKAWSVAATPIAKRLALENDIVVSTFGPSSAHFIASEMKKSNPSIKWVADYRDLWSDSPNLVGSRASLRNRIIKDELSTVGKNADCVTAVSEDMVQKLSKLTKKKVFKFTNGFDIDEKTLKQNYKKISYKPKEAFRIVYTGTIYQNERDPKPLLEAIVKLSDKKLLSKTVTVDFYGARLEYIEELFKNPKYSPFIRIMGHISREKALKIQNDADILLLLESSNEESRGVITGKIFEYIAAGRPIICIGSKSEFEIGEILYKTGTGIVFEKLELSKIEQILLETLKGNGLFESYNPNFEEVINFNRERIANNYFELLENLAYDRLVEQIRSPIKESYEYKKNLPTITHIITGLERGGAERSLYNLLSNGLEDHFRNRVISLMSEGHYGPLLKKKGIPLTCLNMSRGRISLKAFWKLAKTLRNNPSNILQGWMYHGNLAAFLGSLISHSKVKLGWNVRLSLEIYSETTLKSRAAVKVGALLSRWPNLIIYNSNRSRLQHRSMGFLSKNDHFIPNGFLTQKWEPNEIKRKKIRNELSIDEKTKIIGYVGRGDAQKDLPNLFNAFKKILKKHPNTVLVAVGRNLEKYTTEKPRIKFLGERSDIQDIMVSFDILCLSSKAEGFPNVIGEAMACSIPCVATDVGDAKNIVGDTGWIVPPRDTDQLAITLDLALNCHGDELKLKGSRARQRIKNLYSMPSILNKYVSLYKSNINENI